MWRHVKDESTIDVYYNLLGLPIQNICPGVFKMLAGIKI